MDCCPVETRRYTAILIAIHNRCCPTIHPVSDRHPWDGVESAVVVSEVVGRFTVIYVEAKAGAQMLTAVVNEAQQLGGPVLLVIEDPDLWCRDRYNGGGGLSDLLHAWTFSPTPAS